MKNIRSRSTIGINTLKNKAIMTMLLLGTTLLAAHATIDYNYNGAGDRTKSTGWKDYQPQPSQDNNWDGQGHNPKLATYGAVPEAKTIFAVGMLLLPLGVGTLRGMRRNKALVNQ